MHAGLRVSAFGSACSVSSRLCIDHMMPISGSESLTQKLMQLLMGHMHGGSIRAVQSTVRADVDLPCYAMVVP